MDAKTPAAADDTWTTRRLLRWMIDHLEKRGVDSPRLSAEMLLAAAFGVERLELYMDPERPASEAERARLRDSVKRVAAHEPVQFVVGEAWFFSRPFHVSPATLVPRPETERLVEEAISFLRERGSEDTTAGAAGADSDAGRSGAALRVLDLCTGTGCIAISLALAKGVRAEVIATDIVPAALELAKRNAERHGAENIEFRFGDLYDALDGASGGEFDLITANPPYVTDAEWPELPPNVRDYEPAISLRGGADGLDLVRRVVDGAAARLRPGGLLLVEIGHRHRAPALELVARAPGFAGAEVLVDHEGVDRVLRAAKA
ncbi:MAG: peptide chain release factor N(5)-glutamine methyltransferase [Phycisphaerae bacterium]|nr:peptide chain release factor N(5)-glutamine methyltransferase [Phycisphaerae bacterium]